MSIYIYFFDKVDFYPRLWETWCIGMPFIGNLYLVYFYLLYGNKIYMIDVQKWESFMYWHMMWFDGQIAMSYILFENFVLILRIPSFIMIVWNILSYDASWCVDNTITMQVVHHGIYTLFGRVFFDPQL